MMDSIKQSGLVNGPSPEKNGLTAFRGSSADGSYLLVCNVDLGTPTEHKVWPVLRIL
jgi:hypothetical protein